MSEMHWMTVFVLGMMTGIWLVVVLWLMGFFVYKAAK